jgi:16S rRNA pseudouridine516 synthase
VGLSIEHILHSQGFGTRKVCRALVRAGQVSIAGDVLDDPFAEFAVDGLNFCVAGTTWAYRPQAYLMLSKPAGHECSRSPKHHASVLDLLPAPLIERGVQPVGRLDEDTTGLLLLSDDGQFIHRLISPKHKVAKVYAVTLKHPADDTLVAELLGGVQLHDEPEPVAALACTAISEAVIHLTLGEGKYHQVKRMVAAAGNRVAALRRIRIGGLALPDDLAEGDWRWLTEAELQALWA